MSARWAQLQKELLIQVGSLIKRHGFVTKRSDQGFYSKRPFGLAGLHLSFIPHGDVDFDVTADVAVRFDAVEELVYPGAKTFSVGAELGNLSVGEPRRWTVASEAAVSRAATEITAAFEALGIDYIERLRTLDQLFSVLVRNDQNAWLYCPFASDRWRRVLALAWLLRRYGDLDRLTKEGEAFLRGRSDPGVTQFMEFAAKLRSLPMQGQ